MAFKMAATNGSNKQYLYPKAEAGLCNREWEYVTPDAATAVDASGYISSGTSDGDAAIGMLKIGDRIWSTQVASIDDTRTIEDDCKAGISDVSLHVVLDNTGSIIDLSDDILGATVTYGD
jgi:hypothetical protein